MKTKIFVTVICFNIQLCSQTIPYQYGWPRSASGDWGLYNCSPTIADIDLDGILNISLTKSFATPEHYVWKANGAFQPGFPVSLPFGSLQNSGSIEISAVGNVSGDAALEVVFGDENGQLFVFTKNGKNETGTPVMLGGDNRISTPALVDLDSNGTCEIIVASFNRESPYTNAQLHVLTWTGSGFSEFPNFPISFPYASESSPCVGDLDSDGKFEIVYITGGRLADSTYSKIHALRLNGTELDGYPIDISYNTTGNTPTLYDLDFDGNLEIIVKILPLKTGINGIYAFDFRGNTLPNFPFPIRGGHPYAGVAVADVDGDGIPELAFGAGVPVDSGMIYAYKLNGSLLPGFPAMVNATWVDGAVTIADVSGDSIPDFIGPTNEGFIYAFTSSGTIVPGFPLQAENVHIVTGFNCSPTITDIDNDGDTEIFAGSLNKRVYGWDTPGKVTRDMWVTYKGNAQRTGGQLRGYRPTSITNNNLSSPSTFSISQNYPNPFNSSTSVAVELPSETDLTLSVFDATGNLVLNAYDGILSSGRHNISINAEDLSSGIYFYKVTCKFGSLYRKMILLK